MASANTQTYLRFIAVAIAFNAAIGLLISANSLADGDAIPTGLVVPFVLGVSVNLVFCIGAYGLWRTRSWSWWIAAAWCAFNVVRIGTYSYLSREIPQGADMFWLIVLGVSLFYLFRREMGDIFNIRLSRPLSALAIAAIGGLLAAFPYVVFFTGRVLS